MNQTDITENVGKHKFEVAGLGLAPFRFVRASENVITHPDGTQQAGGTCDYCGNGIRTECWVADRTGRRFKVGCNCIEKVGERGILKAYKSSPEYRQKQRQVRAQKAKIVLEQLTALIEAHKATLAAMPHPHGFKNRETGEPLTNLDQVQWLLGNCGASGRASLLKVLQRRFGDQHQPLPKPQAKAREGQPLEATQP